MIIHVCIQSMEKSFNFFKTKQKKENERHRNGSKSNSSKNSYTRSNEKKSTVRQLPISKKQRQIRAGIESRFAKSKIKHFKYESKRQQSQDSSEMEQFKHLKYLTVVDLKEYHKGTNYNSNSTSREQTRFKLRLRIKDERRSNVRTEGNEEFMKKTPREQKRSLKKTEEWKFISIQLKEDISRPKSKKKQFKINSHRSYIQQNQSKTKSNLTYSINKCFKKPIKSLSKSKYKF